MRKNRNGEVMRCRGCNRLAVSGDGLEWEWCYYGGDVCSRDCDIRACLELERCMPGHGYSQMRLGQAAQQHMRRVWGDD